MGNINLTIFLSFSSSTSPLPDPPACKWKTTLIKTCLKSFPQRHVLWVFVLFFFCCSWVKREEKMTSRREGSELMLLYTRKSSDVWTHCSLLMLLLLSRCLHILQLQHFNTQHGYFHPENQSGLDSNGLQDSHTYTHTHTHFQLNWDFALGIIRSPLCVLCVCTVCRMQPCEEEPIRFCLSYTNILLIHQGGVCLRSLLSLPCFQSVSLGPAARHSWIVFLNGCVKVSRSILLLL